MESRIQGNKATVRLALAVVAALLVGGCTGNVKIGADAVRDKIPDGYVEMKAVQAAYIGSGSAGEGTFSYHGRQYKFNVGGLGIGGIGVSSIEASGEVYDLRDMSQFPGAYAQARYGIAIGTASTGELWLQNGAGVIMHLKAKRTGLMLSLGGDAVVISMK